MKTVALLCGVALVGLLLTIVSAESQALTRGRALELIKAAAVSEKTGLRIGIDVGQQPDLGTSSFHGKLEAFKAAGIIVISSNPFRVELTPKGEEMARGAKQERYGPVTRIYLPTATTREIREVTGILRNQGVAQAEFTWRWGTLTAAGQALARHGLRLDSQALESTREPNPIQKGSATFMLYDDGWRMMEMSSPAILFIH